MQFRRKQSSWLHLLRHSKGGSATIEIALTLPVIIFVTFAIFDIGRGIFYYTTVNNIAAETVRFASVRGQGSPTEATAQEIQDFAIAKAVGMDENNLTVTVEYFPDASAGSDVQVTVDYDLRFYLAGFFDGATITLTGESQMEVL